MSNRARKKITGKQLLFMNARPPPTCGPIPRWFLRALNRIPSQRLIYIYCISAFIGLKRLQIRTKRRGQWGGTAPNKEDLNELKWGNAWIWFAYLCINLALLEAAKDMGMSRSVRCSIEKLFRPLFKAYGLQWCDWQSLKTIKFLKRQLWKRVWKRLLKKILAVVNM